VLDSHGRLDLLVANAVAWPRNEVATGMSWRDSLRANVEGPVALIAAALPHLLTRPGRLVLISSTVAVDGMAGATTYAASKAALHGAVVALSAEHAPVGVLTNAVLPGLTLTDRAERLVPRAARDEVMSRTPHSSTRIPPPTSPRWWRSWDLRPTATSPASSSASTAASDSRPTPRQDSRSHDGPATPPTR
jgi:NAD(P)-dependent dehydrogenase (short-subunit alcohol dehydrogenase family)